MSFFGRHGHDAEHGFLRGAVYVRHHFDALDLAVPFDFHGNDGVAVWRDGLRNIRPFGNFLVADADDAVAGCKARLFGR